LLRVYLLCSIPVVSISCSVSAKHEPGLYGPRRAVTHADIRAISIKMEIIYMRFAQRLSRICEAWLSLAI